MTTLLDGKATAAQVRAELAETIQNLSASHGRPPGLAVILVGDDPASQVYVRSKERACEEIGVASFSHRPGADITQAELEALIDELNANDKVDGILLQLPLPRGLDSQALLERIDPDKDVDGFHPVNVGRLTLGLPGYRSCTPAGVMTLLSRYGIDPSGKKAVVVGRSNIVGKPMALMLLEKNATVEICHSRTANLTEECLSADILISAVGIAGFITAGMVRPDAVVVDVGINRTDDGLCGDCDFQAIKAIASAVTPVPGGVGPMTIAQLMANTVEAYQNHIRS